MIQNFSKRQKIYFSLIINIIFPLAGVSTDIYLPSLPAMSDHFQTTKAMLQLTVTSFLMAIAIGQFIAGPISDAYGRKKPLILSIIMQFLATVPILIMPSVLGVIVCRFLQGLSAAFMMVPARAIINDVFTGEALKRQFNYSTISFALAPILAPYIGGYFQQYFGWESNFIFIICYQIIIFGLLIFGFKETLIQTKYLSVQHFTQSYKKIFSNNHFIICVSLLSVLMGYFSLFSILGPFLIQVTLNKDPLFYGKVALFMGLAWFLGNVFNRILFRYGEHGRTVFSMILMLVASMFLVYWSVTQSFTVIGFSVPTFILIFASGFIFPIYIGEALMIFPPDIAATANGCLFSMTWLGFGIYTLIGAVLNASTPLPISLVFFAISLLCILLYYALCMNVKKKGVS